MRCAEFKGCCGATISYDWGGTNTTLGENEEDDVFSEERVLKQLHEVKNRFTSHAFAFIILNEEQHEHYHNFFIKGGFELVKSNLSKNHNNVLYCYMYLYP